MAQGSLLQLFLVVGLLAVLVICQKEPEIPEDCGPCDPEKCESPDKCPAGRRPDRCQCCQTCAKGLYELCEHKDAEKRPNVQYGVCGNNLECHIREDIPDSEAICYCLFDETVCGTDGVTYENICQLNAAKNMGDNSLEKEKDGPCNTVPKIVSAPENIKNKTGTDVSLSCEAMGYPIPNIEWIRKRVDGKVIELPGDDQQISVNKRGGPEKYEITSWLLIQNLKKKHEGDYSCVADNTNGRDVSPVARINVVVDKEQEKKFHGKKHHRGPNDL